MTKQFMAALVAVLLALAPAGPARAQPAAPAPAAAPAAAASLPAAADNIYPLVLAAGAMAGIAGYALLSAGMWTLPLPGAVGHMAIAAAGVTAPNRVYAIASAVVGAWLADWGYRQRGD